MTALTMRMSRSWKSRMTWVPAWVQILARLQVRLGHVLDDSGQGRHISAQAMSADRPAQGRGSRRERLGLLAPKPSGLARRLDRGLLDVGHGPFEFVGILCADADQAGGAEDAVASVRSAFC